MDAIANRELGARHAGPTPHEPMKILIVEDNDRVAQFVCKGLRQAGHAVDHAANGRDGLFLASSEPYDVIVLDRMLPGGIDGLSIVDALRRTGNQTPILILSAMGEVEDRIRGLRIVWQAPALRHFSARFEPA